MRPAEAFSNLARFDGVRYGYRSRVARPDRAERKSRAYGFGAAGKRRQMLGAYLLCLGCVRRVLSSPRRRLRSLIAADYARAYERVDVVAMPASSTTAFKFGELSDPTQMYLSDMFTVSINIAGNGGIPVPCGLGVDSGLPVAVPAGGSRVRRSPVVTFRPRRGARLCQRGGCAGVRGRARNSPGKGAS